MHVQKPTDSITKDIIASAIAVHNAFGPGLFEKTYVSPLLWELEDRGYACVTELPVSITHRGRTLERAYLIDILVEDLVIVEIKSVEAILPVHLAQAITYVRLANKPAGLLINFNVKRLVDGVRRVLNDRVSGRGQSNQPSDCDKRSEGVLSGARPDGGRRPLLTGSNEAQKQAPE